MSVKLETLFQAITHEYGQNASSKRHQHDFIRACAAAVNQLNAEVRPSTAIDIPDATSGALDGVDAEDTDILLAGTRYYYGIFGVATERTDKAELERQWLNAIGQYQVDTVEDAVSDDDETDVVGLGYQS